MTLFTIDNYITYGFRDLIKRMNVRERLDCKERREELYHKHDNARLTAVNRCLTVVPALPSD